MQDTAGTWLMTSLPTSPLLSALMRTGAGLRVLLLGFPAGATADIIDRRRLLIFWQVWMLSTVAVLSVLTFAGIISPWTLLALTFLVNVGAAMNNPAWQAIVPELVPRSDLPNAVAVNSAGYNLARAVGPALGGLLVAAFATVTMGAGAVFLVNSLSFIAVIVVLVHWRRKPLFNNLQSKQGFQRAAMVRMHPTHNLSVNRTPGKQRFACLPVPFGLRSPVTSNVTGKRRTLVIWSGRPDRPFRPSSVNCPSGRFRKCSGHSDGSFPE